MCVLAYSSYLGAQGFLLENDFDWICAIVGDNFINLTSENSIPNRNNYSNSKLPKSSRYQWVGLKEETAKR